MSGSRKSAGVHVAFLRGINVGGKNKLAMSELVTFFEDAGCTDVKSYIQSGNVVFRASSSLAKSIPDLVVRAIGKRIGRDIPVVVRTAGELQKVVAGNPFLPSSDELKNLHVGFLADRPSASRIRGLDPDRSPPDEFAVHGRELYLHCPNGVARSKLTNSYFDSKLATISTMRNWNTVLKVLDLASR